jgi:hypothetical protein
MNGCINSYKQNLSNNIVQQACLSLVASTGLGYVVSGGIVPIALTCGAIATAASLIHSALMPLIRMMEPDNAGLFFAVTAILTVAIAASAAITAGASLLGASVVVPVSTLVVSQFFMDYMGFKNEGEAMPFLFLIRG